MKKAIIGMGGFAREISCCIPEEITFFVEDNFINNGLPALPLSTFNENEYEVIVAVGDPKVRSRIVESLPPLTKFFSFVHPSASILSESVEIGEGCIICAGVIITTNVSIGCHCQLNILSTVGHDTIIGDYFTTAPGAKISGNCVIGNSVYVGTNSCVREKTTICSDVTIGLASGCVKDIQNPGVYVGCPLRKIK
jgi:sugar O-acyltransferase (sialic acid O-acetyltransferase NeuD family)